MSMHRELMAPPVEVVLGCIAFAIFWVLVVFPKVGCLPIGRTAGSLLGAMLMVLFRVMTPEQAYAAIDLQILGLLFGTMVVSIYLEKADTFNYLSKLVTWKNMGPKDLMCRICLVSAISSSLFTNDTACVFLTKFVLELAYRHNLPPRPFLVALATSANIGSSVTPIGNPQNLVIAIRSQISFGDFVVGIMPAMLAGLMVNALLLLCMYRTKLVSHHHYPKLRVSNHDDDIDDESNEVEIRIFTSNGCSERNYINDIGEINIPLMGALSVESSSKAAAAKGKELGKRWKWRKPCVYLVTLGMLIAFLLGLNMSWTAITAALALILLDFTDAHPCLNKVSYPLLIFFCGMFIAVDGFNKTGIPSTLWNSVEPYAHINDAFGISLLAFVILFLSNLASNVPAVLLLGVPVAASAAAISGRHEKKAWLILAWVSTVAGNLSLFGSAANLIVCEEACQHAREKDDCQLSFWEHLQFGLPSTLLVTTLGLAFMCSDLVFHTYNTA